MMVVAARMVNSLNFVQYDQTGIDYHEERFYETSFANESITASVVLAKK